MQLGRQRQSCALMSTTNDVGQINQYVIVAGGYNQLGVPMNTPTVEVLDVTQGVNNSPGWSPGPDLPLALSEGQLITDPETGGVLMIGGLNNDNVRVDTLYSLTSITGPWELIGRLDVPRSLHWSFFVPDDQLPCIPTMC
jgi:hypothetical protein